MGRTLRPRACFCRSRRVFRDWLVLVGTVVVGVQVAPRTLDRRPLTCGFAISTRTFCVSDATGDATGLREQGRDRRSRVTLHPRHDVLVDAHGHLRGGMTQPLLDHFHRHAFE